MLTALSLSYLHHRHLYPLYIISMFFIIMSTYIIIMSTYIIIIIIISIPTPYCYNRQLQRQVDLATHAQQEMERELDLMRQRLTDATSDQLFQSSMMRMGEVIVPPPPPASLGQASSASPASSSLWSKYPNRSPSLRQAKTSDASENMRRSMEGSQRRSTAATGRGASSSSTTTAAATAASSYTSNVTNDPTPPKSIQLSGIPIPLEESDVRNDLQDVITALGVNPQHLGLRVNVNAGRTSTSSSNRAPRQQHHQQQQQQQSYSPPISSYDVSGMGIGMGMTRQHLDESKTLSVSSSSLSSTAVDMSSVEKRLQDLVSAALESPVRQRRI